MAVEMEESAAYRKNVGIDVTDGQGRLLWAKRIRSKNAWQFPQGGIDSGESVQQALYRELHEELGLSQDDVLLLAETQDWLRYDIPEPYRRRSEKFICLGQDQKWFLLQLLADASSVRLDVAEQPEFDEWCWVDYWYPLDQVIEFKQAVYKKVLNEFAAYVL